MPNYVISHIKEISSYHFSSLKKLLQKGQSYLPSFKHQQKIIKVIKSIACYFNRKDKSQKKEIEPEVRIFHAPQQASAGFAIADEVNLIPFTGDQRQILNDAKMPGQEGEPLSYQMLLNTASRPKGSLPE